MNEYFYKCFNCSKEFSSEIIENEYHYLCPACGTAEKNKPLIGVLEVVYNYDKLRRIISRDKFLNYGPGEFWLYRELWPLQFLANKEIVKGIPDEKLERLALNRSSFLKVNFEDFPIFIQDETRNPTYHIKIVLQLLQLLKEYSLV